MNRSISAVLPSQRLVDDGDMCLWRALPSPDRDALGPFVFIDHYRHRSRRGIGDKPHPHAGIEVLSYLLEGGMEHRDSLGFIDRLDAGDVQWIRAGRGMLHAEQPSGGRHGLQLWTSLPSEHKLDPPAYRALRRADIPESSASGAQLRVVAGSVNGIAGPLELTRPTVFAHARLEAGASLSMVVDAAEELGLYVVDGAVAVERSVPLRPGALALLGPGDSLTVTAASGAPADVVLLGGVHIDEPRLFSGPFVMDTPERIEGAKRDFSSGRMGRLDGVPF
jgi:quercetin 2,3-dioxygenase